jgi:hypothetical protein
VAKERILKKDEVLFRDETSANYFYFLLKGRVRVEKVVDVNSINYWPKTSKSWCERTIKNHVLYKIQDIEAFTMFGETECVDNKPWPV